MARKPSREPESVETRERPLRTMLALVAGFLVIVGVAVWTVILPELRDDAGEDVDGAETTVPAVPQPAAAGAPPPAP
jgi:hypothetical protein